MIGSGKFLGLGSMTTCWQTCSRWRFLLTSRGYMGFGLLDMKEDDEVSFPFSGPTPVVLRDIGNGFHQFVGEAYVHGITQGEVMKYVEERSRSGSLHFIDVRVKVTGRRRISLSFT
jgi:hypothetical protein